MNNNNPLFIVKEQIVFTMKNPFINLGWIIAIIGLILLGLINGFFELVSNYIFTITFSSIILYILGSQPDSLKEKNQ